MHELFKGEEQRSALHCDLPPDRTYQLSKVVDITEQSREAEIMRPLYSLGS